MTKKAEKDFWNDYFDWLLERVCIERLRPVNKIKHYSFLFQQLMNTPFQVILDRDRNRISDGMDLRSEYGIAFYDRKCSVLEVLVALSIRIETEYLGEPGNEHPEEIFWEFLDNLDLTWYINRRYDEQKVGDILNRWMDRRFYSNGVGSICPRKDRRGFVRDERDVELWDQVIGYIRGR